MFYDNIPAIVDESVRSLYRMRFTDPDTWHFLPTGERVADIKVLLSQISLVLCIVFLACIIFTVILRRGLLTQLSGLPDANVVPSGQDTSEPATTGVLREKWNEIVRTLESPHEAQWKSAVMEADKLVDDALARSGYPGATFGDRLSNMKPGTLLSLDGIWWAHKVRNRVAHEVDYFLRYTEARQAVGYYEVALTELQYL